MRQILIIGVDNLKLKEIVHKIVLVEIGIADRSELDRPELHQNIVFFLDD